MKLKKIIKAILPKFVLKKIHYRKYKKLTNACFGYDADRFTFYSNSYEKWDNSNKLLGQIIAEYHVIEKGLVMPDMRLGFGQTVLMDLIEHCNMFEINYGDKDEQFRYALSVIFEYKFEHDKNNFSLNSQLQEAIALLEKRYSNITHSEQKAISKSEYFAYTKSSFDQFSKSRKSLRNFTGKIETHLLEQAISLAQNAPSACNRQPNRVYIIENNSIKEKVLGIHSGNRGFGHLADKILILTAEIGLYFGLNERNDIYVNGGIHAMNLLYALHFYEIGACPLNWCVMPKDDIELRNLVGIAPSESIIMLIACGGVPSNFKLVTSKRSNVSKIITVL
jgi:nitroreductase